jgi:hypothetical protein
MTGEAAVRRRVGWSGFPEKQVIRDNYYSHRIILRWYCVEERSADML